MFILKKSEVSKNDMYFCILCICTFFLAFGSSGSSIENSIQGIIYLIFSIPVIIQYIKHNKQEIYIFLALAFILILPTIFSIFPIYIESVLRIVSIFSLLLCFFSISLFFKKNINYIKYFIYYLIILSFTHVIIIINKLLNLDNHQNFDWTTDISFFGNIRHITSFISMALICCLYLVSYQNKYKYLYAILSTIFLSFIMWSGTRSAYLSLCFVFMYFILVSSHKIKTALTIIGVSILSLFCSLPLPKGAALGIERAMSDSSSGRMKLWLDTIHYIAQNPFLGYGADSFNLVHHLYGGYGSHLQQAHNFILQILIEFGLIGFITIIFIFYTYSKKIQLTINQNQQLFIAILINYFIIGLFDGVAYYTFSIFFVGYSIAILNINNKEKFI